MIRKILKTIKTIIKYMALASRLESQAYFHIYSKEYHTHRLSHNH